MKVPRVESKLRVFCFKIQFRTQVSEFKRSLNTDLMKKIIYLGNTLNQGTARGAAVGFKLDSLLKLTDTRASTSRMTLMHLSLQAAKKPALLDFHLDFVSLEAATKIQLKALAEEMQAIIKGLEKVKQELAALENDGPVSEVFHKEKPATLDCSPRTICRRHIMAGSYLYKCIWEALQQRIRMILINMQLTPYML
ncbi:hypothetical protein ES332_A05G368800v1 [Gossypium tomentosum]|uniref:FH2 domain-containing protein n=1 Tax=Gossypium tomentosum TaxID=34277 RepID=A0A5D2QP68_GOSTO|nr:hypothetical protein ES332_A05G368800v1 [Gossypium tomentosum]